MHVMPVPPQEQFDVMQNSWSFQASVSVSTHTIRTYLTKRTEEIILTMHLAGPIFSSSSTMKTHRNLQIKEIKNQHIGYDTHLMYIMDLCIFHKCLLCLLF